MTAADRRDLARLEARRRGEPTLPIRAELEGLSDDEQVELIGARAALVAAFYRRPSSARRRPSSAAAEPAVQLLKRRARAERALAGDVTLPPRRVPGGSCPWCSQPTGVAPACGEHLELELELRRVIDGDAQAPGGNRA